MRWLFCAAACLVSCPSLLHGQDTLKAGSVVTVTATHSGANTNEYRLKVQLGDALPVTRLVGGEIRFENVIVPLGAKTFTIEAVGSGGVASASLPVTVIAQDVVPTTPVLKPCSYTSPQGIQSTKAIGDSVVHGYNPLDFSSVTARQGHADRVAQLVSWGFQVREFPDFSRNRVLMFAVCKGVP